MNGYNDKLSLNTDPRSIAKRGKNIHIDFFEYSKAKSRDLGGFYDAYELYDQIKLSNNKLRNIRAKVKDCLTFKDILGTYFHPKILLEAYKKNIRT